MTAQANAYKRGKRAAISFKPNKPKTQKGNPYCYNTQRLEHDTWARAYTIYIRQRP